MCVVGFRFTLAFEVVLGPRKGLGQVLTLKVLGFREEFIPSPASEAVLGLRKGFREGVLRQLDCIWSVWVGNKF